MTSVPPPFDPELAAALELISAQLPPMNTIEQVRQMREGGAGRIATDEQLSRDGRFVVEDRVVPGPSGGPEVTLLVCRPAEARGPRPLIYYTHGGGMVLGTYRDVAGALDWAEALDAIVVSVEYRLAPEHPHPAPVEDVYAGYVWTVEHAEKLGADPERIVIAGASAGGGLTAALALLARDRKAHQALGQLLMIPMLDDRNDTPSAHQMVGIGVWDRAANELGWGSLLGEARGTEGVSEYAAPARAADLSGLPPAFIDVGSAETFRDEAVAYASRIWQAGGVAELHVWPGGFHGFAGLAPQAAVSHAARAAHLSWLRRLLGE
jgi:acetyl esterase/lipase